MGVVAGVAGAPYLGAALGEGVEPACDGDDAVHHDQPPDDCSDGTGTDSLRDGEAVLENHVANETDGDGGITALIATSAFAVVVETQLKKSAAPKGRFARARVNSSMKFSLSDKSNT